MREGIFSRRVVIFIISSAVVLFSLSILFSAYETQPSTEMKGSAGRSISAIGYAGYYDLLQRLDFPVSRKGSTREATLVFTEPSTLDLDRIEGSATILIILPKWMGKVDKKHRGWVSEVYPVSNLSVNILTENLINSNTVVRRTDWPDEWDINKTGVTPTGSGLVQLIAGKGVEPVIASPDGILVGKILSDEKTIWIVSDPDILSNHGINKGNNAELAVTLTRMLRKDPHSEIIFDAYSYKSQSSDSSGSPLKVLFSFPYVIVTLLVCAAAALLALAGTGRFGTPKRTRREEDFGKAKLIDNSARLLDYAGYHEEVLRRYIHMTVRTVAHTLHAPTGSNNEMVDWLDKVGKARGVTASCREIISSVSSTEGSRTNIPLLLESARKIYIWKGEMLNGPLSNR